jgi:hypothetical protein
VPKKHFILIEIKNNSAPLIRLELHLRTGWIRTLRGNKCERERRQCPEGVAGQQSEQHNDHPRLNNHSR